MIAFSRWNPIKNKLNISEHFIVLSKIARYIEKTVIILLKMNIYSSSAAIKFTENTSFAAWDVG